MKALHRVLGLGTCLLLLAWFLSGVAMLFVAYPGLELSPGTTLDGRELRTLAIPSIPAGPLPELRLRRINGRVAWQFLDVSGRIRAVDLSGAPLTYGAQGAQILEEPDQWTFSSSLEPYFPLARRELEGGVLEYASLATGERVLRLDSWERVWLTVGPLVHWIYPRLLRSHRGVWRSLVLALSLAGALLSTTGLVFGYWLQRRARTPWFSSPYRRWAFRLHHQAGLVFGVMACTWTLSGALSFNPARWSTGDLPSERERLEYGGGKLALGRFLVPPGEALAGCTEQAAIASLTLVQLGGQPWYRCDMASGPALWTRGDLLSPVGTGAPAQALVAAARGMRPGLRRVVTETAPDAYYYPTVRSGPVELPYLRLDYDDGASLYLGLRSGEILRRYERSGRWERWLFHGLHSLDFAPLYTNRSGWRALLLTLLLGGAGLAATGVWLAGRRLRRWVA